eukprot:snap_masked-scaffold529_size145900-processed-gene-0.12 protein:Tk10771 transcript:snap_masked-scaffold529_size145900-processed-gene-0.12-mRNA-1 annotation:"hypothetical protein"
MWNKFPALREASTKRMASNQAGLPSFNDLTVHAVAMETWRAFHSQDGPDGLRNALGQVLFSSNVATRSGSEIPSSPGPNNLITSLSQPLRNVVDVSIYAPDSANFNPAALPQKTTPPPRTPSTVTRRPPRPLLTASNADLAPRT